MFGLAQCVLKGRRMDHSHKYPLIGCGHGIPLPPEVLEGVANSLYATLWITMLSSPKLWETLRRIPPKAFLLDRIDAWLAFARKGGKYVHSLEGEERAAAIEERSLPFRRLLDLLLVWDPPVVTPEIREAARALHIAEFQRPPSDDWDLSHEYPPIPLEATLPWPEGEWDEEAFLAGRFGNETPSGS
jgi:hypothetical protein